MKDYDINIYKGTTFKLNIAYTDSTSAIIDLTGYTARMQVRRTYGSAIITELTTENGGIAITALTGGLDLLITATATTLLTAVSGRYDLEIISSGGEVTRILQGDARIIENVTR